MAEQQQQHDVQKLRSEIAQLRDDLKQLSDSVRDIAAHRSEAARERLRESVDHARERAVKAERAIEHQIQEHPLTSILAVFIGGLITGLLLQKRR